MVNRILCRIQIDPLIQLFIFILFINIRPEASRNKDLFVVYTTHSLSLWYILWLKRWSHIGAHSSALHSIDWIQSCTVSQYDHPQTHICIDWSSKSACIQERSQNRHTAVWLILPWPCTSLWESPSDTQLFSLESIPSSLLIEANTSSLLISLNLSSVNVFYSLLFINSQKIRIVAEYRTDWESDFSSCYIEDTRGSESIPFPRPWEPQIHQSAHNESWCSPLRRCERNWTVESSPSTIGTDWRRKFLLPLSPALKDPLHNQAPPSSLSSYLPSLTRQESYLYKTLKNSTISWFLFKKQWKL